MEEICNDAMTDLDSLCKIHDTEFHMNKLVKQEIMLVKLKEIEKKLEKVPELMHNNANDSQYNAKIAFILGKAKNCFDNYNAESEVYLRRAVKLHYQHIEAWNTLAECLWKKTEYSEAKSCLLTSISIQPNIEAYQLLSMLVKLIKNTDRSVTTVQYNQRITDESVKYAKAAINIDILDAKSWYILGNAWCSKYFSASLDIIDVTKAITCYNKAITLYTSSTSSASAASSADSASSNDANPNPSIPTATTAIPGIPDLYYNKAELCMYMQSYTEAIQCYTYAHQLDPYINPAIPDMLIYIQNYVQYLQSLTNATPTTTNTSDATTCTTITEPTKCECSYISTYTIKRKLIEEYCQQISQYYENLKHNRGPAKTKNATMIHHQPVDYQSMELHGWKDMCVGNYNQQKVLIVKVILGLHSKTATTHAKKNTSSSSNNHGSTSVGSIQAVDTVNHTSNYVHSHAESSYLVMDIGGNYGIVSIYHIGTNVSLCDSHVSSNCILHICHPQIRSNMNNTAFTLPEDAIPIVQVFDLSTIFMNYKPITSKKIATTVLNISSYDS